MTHDLTTSRITRSVSCSALNPAQTSRTVAEASERPRAANRVSSAQLQRLQHVRQQFSSGSPAHPRGPFCLPPPLRLRAASRGNPGSLREQLTVRQCMCTSLGVQGVCAGGRIRLPPNSLSSHCNGARVCPPSAPAPLARCEHACRVHSLPLRGRASAVDTGRARGAV